MADVLALQTRPMRNAQSVIEVLRHALEEAVAGRVSSVCVALVRPDGSVNAYTSDSDQVGALLGALSAAQIRLVLECG